MGVKITIEDSPRDYDQNEEIFELNNDATKAIDGLKDLREKGEKFADMRDALVKKLFNKEDKKDMKTLSDEYKDLKKKNAYGEATDVVLAGMKKRIFFKNLPTDVQKGLEKE